MNDLTSSERKRETLAAGAVALALQTRSEEERRVPEYEQNYLRSCFPLVQQRSVVLPAQLSSHAAKW
jgi:hypothetical protein